MQVDRFHFVHSDLMNSSSIQPVDGTATQVLPSACPVDGTCCSRDDPLSMLQGLEYSLQVFHNWKEVACSHTGSLQLSLAAVPPLFCLTACCVSTGFAARGAEAIGLCQLLLQSFMCESILLSTE